MGFLTDRTLATGVTLQDLIHIVITGDTSQNPAGSSYKATIKQVSDAILSGFTGNTQLYEVGSGTDSTQRVGVSADAGGNCSLVSGGFCNTASGDYSFVGGGQSNTSLTPWSLIVGGCENYNRGNVSTISGGYKNSILATGNLSFIGGGCCNEICNQFSVLTGGRQNKVVGTYLTISGGYCNTLSGDTSFIGGGRQNTNFGSCSTIGGGSFNTLYCKNSVISGGLANTISSKYSTIGGGHCNTTSAIYSTISGGYLNTTSGCYSAISGGWGNSASGYANFIGGGAYNIVNQDYSTIAGGANNKATLFSTIAGGGSNTASNYSTVGGGVGNRAFGLSSTVSGGDTNRSSGLRSFIGGGYRNTVIGCYSTISGGYINTGSGDYSSILGGSGNTVTHQHSSATGFGIKSVSACTFHTNYLALQNTPVTDSTNNNVLVRDTSTGVVKTKNISTHNYGLFTQTGNSATVTATVAETTIIGPGLGTLTVPANGFYVGDSFSLVIGGHISFNGADTLTVNVKSNGTILASTGAINMQNSTNKHWQLKVDFTIRALGGLGVASIATLGSFSYVENAADKFEGYDISNVESTLFDTTISNTLDVTVQYSSTSATNNMYSEVMTLTKTY